MKDIMHSIYGVVCGTARGRVDSCGGGWRSSLLLLLRSFVGFGWRAVIVLRVLAQNLAEHSITLLITADVVGWLAGWSFTCWRCDAIM